MWKCKHCNKEFDFTRNTDKAGHSRWCSENPKLVESKQANAERRSHQADLKFGAYENYDVSCHAVECDVVFQVSERTRLFPQQENYFCSRSCANFRGRGEKWADTRGTPLTQYATICWAHHEKKCVVCGEDKIVDAHHIDEDHSNNDPTNFAPLCPTHHQYWHSRYKHLVEDSVIEYVRLRWK